VTEQVVPPATPESPAPEAPKKKGGIGGKVLSILAVLVVVAVVLALKFGLKEIWAFVSGDVSNAKVGDCITETVKADASDAKVVGCDKPEAKNKVVGIVSNVSEADFETKNQTLCDAYPTWENVIWKGTKGGKGDAWCLEPVTK
jgi:hypothetical protein